MKKQATYLKIYFDLCLYQYILFFQLGHIQFVFFPL